MTPTAIENPIRIMLVDDHKTVLWGLQQLIDSQRPKMEVVGTASTATEAIETAARLRPDLVLLDIDLGAQSSVDILPALVPNTATVLILTGMRDQATVDSVVLKGARGLVSKEEPPEVLLRAIEKVHAGEIWLGREATGRVFDALWAKGQNAQNKPDKMSLLTPTERKVVDAVVQESGASNKMIARSLCMSEHTLRNHLTAIYQKLDVDNRLKLYVYVTTQCSVSAAFPSAASRTATAAAL